MDNETNRYNPDYAVPPGWALEERLATHDLSYAEFARRCGRSPKLIGDVIAGRAPVEPATAIQFERVLGVDARIWLGMEADYRLHLTRQAELTSKAENTDWIQAFPVDELVERGHIERTETVPDSWSALLVFFGVGSIGAWREKWSRTCESIVYRKSSSFGSDEAALATWVRLGEIEADRQDCERYDKTNFRRALKDIRLLTRQSVPDALKHARKLCNQAGVALVLIKPFPNMVVSGAAWWHSPSRAVIMLSMRYKSNDHLWFSLFHEAGHILLHSKKSTFIDTDTVADTESESESEANEWAARALITQSDWMAFISTQDFTPRAIQEFSSGLGIASGIVVGRLQHERCIPWKSPLNRLKKRLQWRG